MATRFCWTASAINGRDKYQFVGSEIEFQLPVVANGAPVGDLLFEVSADRFAGALKIGDLFRRAERIQNLNDAFGPVAKFRAAFNVHTEDGANDIDWQRNGKVI